MTATAPLPPPKRERPPNSHWYCPLCRRILAESLCRHCERRGDPLYLDGPFA